MIGAVVQKAIVDALKAAPSVAQGRVFDRVPGNKNGRPSVLFPYVTIGSEQVIDDGNSCSDSWEVHVDLHVWSRAVGQVEAKAIAAQVGDRVRGIAAVAGFRLMSVHVDGTRSLTDPDGLTAHVVVSTTFNLDET